MSDNNAFKIKNLKLGYDRKNNIINNLSLDILDGEFVSIIGPNGSGKSTLLRSMAKILKYKSGNIEYKNKNIYSSFKLWFFNFLGKNILHLPIEKIYFNFNKKNKLNLKKDSKYKFKIRKNFFYSVIWEKAKKLGFVDGDLLLQKDLIKISSNLIKVYKYSLLNGFFFDQIIYYDQKNVIKDLEIKHSINGIDKIKLITTYASNFQFKDGDVIYDPGTPKNIHINKFINFLKRKKVKIDGSIYFSNENPFFENDIENNFILNKKINILYKFSKIFKFSDDDILYSFEKPYFSSKEFSRHVSFIPQITNFPSDITVYEFVKMGRYPYSKMLISNKKIDDQKIIDALKSVNLYDLKDKYLENLSGGQKQRAVIALALAQDTKTILLDEPTNHLDIKHQLEIIHLLHDLNHNLKKTIILVIHDINHGMKFSDKIIIMNNGQIIDYGPTNKIVNKKIIKEVFGVDAKVELSQNKKIITDYWIENLNLLDKYHKKNSEKAKINKNNKKINIPQKSEFD